MAAETSSGTLCQAAARTDTRPVLHHQTHEIQKQQPATKDVVHCHAQGSPPPTPPAAPHKGLAYPGRMPCRQPFRTAGGGTGLGHQRQIRHGAISISSLCSAFIANGSQVPPPTSSFASSSCFSAAALSTSGPQPQHLRQLLQCQWAAGECRDHRLPPHLQWSGRPEQQRQQGPHM